MTDGDLSHLVSETRFKEMHLERERVKERKNKILDAYHFGGLGEREKNTILRECIETYLREVQEVLKPPHKKTVPTNEDYWEEVDIGTMRLPDGREMRLKGLKSLFELSNPIRYTQTETTHEYPQGEVQKDTVREFQVPWDTLMRYYYCANEAIAEAGIRYDVDAGKMRTYGFNELSEPEVATDGGSS